MTLLKDTRYAKYIKDREGLEILENDSAFITYKIKGVECFIANMCIDTDLRKQGRAREIISDLSVIAKEAGCKFISGAIDLADHDNNNTLHAALKIGFKVVKANADVLFIVLDIGE